MSSRNSSRIRTFFTVLLLSTFCRPFCLCTLKHAQFCILRRKVLTLLPYLLQVPYYLQFGFNGVYLALFIYDKSTRPARRRVIESVSVDNHHLTERQREAQGGSQHSSLLKPSTSPGFLFRSGPSGAHLAVRLRDRGRAMPGLSTMLGDIRHTDKDCCDLRFLRATSLIVLISVSVDVFDYQFIGAISLHVNFVVSLTVCRYSN